jgi:hypothetical protein
MFSHKEWNVISAAGSLQNTHEEVREMKEEFKKWNFKRRNWQTPGSSSRIFPTKIS